MAKLWLTDSKYKKDAERCKVSLAPCGRIDTGRACLECTVKDCKYAQHTLVFGEDTSLVKKIESLRESALRSLRENDLANALKYTDSILEARDTDKDALNLKGYILFMQSRWNDAIDCFNKIVQTDAKNVSALNNKGTVFMYLSRYNDAVTLFDRVISISPNSPSAWNNKGVALIYLEKYDTALKCFNTATENNIDNSVVWYHSGALNYGMGNLDEAEKCFDRSLKLNQDNEFAKYGKKLLAEHRK